MDGFSRYLAAIAGMFGGSNVDTSWHSVGGGMYIAVEPHEHDASSPPVMDTSDIVSPKEAARMNGHPEVMLRTYHCAGPDCLMSHTFYGRAEHSPIEPLYCPEHAPEGHVNRTRGPADIARERREQAAERAARRRASRE